MIGQKTFEVKIENENESVDPATELDSERDSDEMDSNQNVVQTSPLMYVSPIKSDKQLHHSPNQPSTPTISKTSEKFDMTNGRQGSKSSLTIRTGCKKKLIFSPISTLGELVFI